jgi:serine/threonine-protein kinase
MAAPRIDALAAQTKMVNGNWEQIKEIFDAALQYKPEDRPAFLDRVCSDKETVRHEVESLLSSFDQAEGFMDKPLVSDLTQAATSKANAFAKGHRLGHYEIIEPLGAGGMGEVYLAHDTRLSRRVALKVLPAASAANQEAKQRLWREARAAATLDHPNICAIHEISEADDCIFIVMQYVEGETLAAKLKREKLPLPEILNLAVQIADALAEAHAQGIIHRDIKPANIMVNNKGQAKVLDFGLAKFAAENAEVKSQVATAKALSKSGAILGTVPFMSPEQVRGKRLDVRTDIFSFGAMLYEMSCGRLPFAGDTDAETISAILRDEPSFIEIPDDLQAIVRKSLRKNADERYQTAQAVAADLRQLQKRLELTEAPVVESGAATTPQPFRTTASVGYLISGIKPYKRAASVILVVLMMATLAIVVWLNYLSKPTVERAPLKSIAVLPFKSLNPEADDHYLGLGIADSIIAKSSQIDGLTVRPTSAIRKYVNAEVDSLEAARDQKVDTVLDGTIQQAGERLRVSVTLLNVSDGSVLWAETFNVTFNDIFKMQDEVSRQIAARLRLKLSDAQAARLARRDSANPEAYNYYAKAMYHFYNIRPNLSTRSESDLAIDLFKKALELDPDYALAHAQLGYTYTRIAVFQEENPAWIELAKQQLAIAERLNPQLAEVHAARYFIAFSQYEGWQIDTAFRELRLAQEIDPDLAHSELAGLYNHIGLEDKAIEEYETALQIDPNNEFTKEGYITECYQQNRPDLALELSKRFYNRSPDADYYLEKMMAKEAEPLIAQQLQKNPNSDTTRIERVVLLALQGKHDEAQAAGLEFLATVRKNRGYHHYAYAVARVFAQGGKSAEALKYLRYTATNGFPCYPLFERDPYLNPIRKDPQFIKFLAELKAQWQGYRQQFG